MKWIYDPKWDVWNLLGPEGVRLAFITRRNSYCDRGHFLGHVEIGGLDSQDGWPNYYMRLDRAQEEIIDFLNWRLHKKRTEQVMETKQ